MKVLPPVKIGGVNTLNPVDLANDDNDAVRIGLVTVPGSIIYDRSLWFVGIGAPPSPDALGAKDGDCYLDSDTGDVYRLVT